MNTMYIDLGDPSNDGHGMTEKILVESNKTHKQILKAYKASCKKTGVSFNNNDDFTGIDRNWEVADNYRLCTDYEDHGMHKEFEEIILQHGCTLLDDIEKYQGEYYLDSKTFVELFMWFVSLSLKDFEWNLIEEEKIPCVNKGFQMGYGLFSN